MDWKLMMCAIFGHAMKWANGGIDGIAGARDCTRCGLHEPAVVWDKAPPMPACKPPRTEQADRIQALHLAAGDTLILSHDNPLTTEQRAHIRAQALAYIPEGCKVMVLHGGLKVGGTISGKPEITASARAQIVKDAVVTVISQIGDPNSPVARGLKRAAPHIPQPSPGIR